MLSSSIRHDPSGEQNLFVLTENAGRLRAVFSLPEFVEGNAIVSLRNNLGLALRNNEMELVFDFSSVCEMSLSGVDYFLTLGQALKRSGRRRPEIAHGQKGIVTFFEKSGLSEYFSLLEATNA